MLFTRLVFIFIDIDKGSACYSYRSGCQKAGDGKSWANSSNSFILLIAVIPATLKARLIDLFEHDQLLELILIFLNFLPSHHPLPLLLSHSLIDCSGRWDDIDLIDALQSQIPVIHPNRLFILIILIWVYKQRLFSRWCLLDGDLVDRLLQQIFDLDLLLHLLVLPFQVLKAMDQEALLALLGLSAVSRLQLFVEYLVDSMGPLRTFWSLLLQKLPLLSLLLPLH